ncbi:polymer-forming cytoskeletal protein [bacterium]|nr:MAG: polymer-forming cytoskeletal protein [bacterium]
MPTKRSPFDYRQTASFYFSALAKVEGQLNEQEDIVIDGEFIGRIQTGGFCEISENGNFQGDLKAKSITILGNSDGEIHGEDTVVVKKSAKVHGIIITPRISVDAGAQVDARIKNLNKKVIEHSE